jgi:hypothetical protein
MKGGRREGAGRKKGIPNKSTAERMAALMAGGESPLEYMLRIMRDKTVEDSIRADMARSAAPYMHPRLATTEIKGDPDKPLQHKVEVCFVSAG